MATDKHMIIDALKIRPTDIFNKDYGLDLFLLSRVVILDAAHLRMLVDLRAGKNISWEEWVDVRSAYAAHHGAVVLELVEGSYMEQFQRAVYRPPVGTNYILAEEL
jgi:hypothetical protein